MRDDSKIKLPLSYEDAKYIITSIGKKVNQALDYNDAFVFTHSSQSDSINDYGWAIYKENGKIVNISEYLFNRKSNASPTKIPF